jgi:hypothetical protein
LAEPLNRTRETDGETRTMGGYRPFRHAPLRQRLLLAGLVGAAFGLWLTGELGGTGLGAVVAMGVVPILVVVEVAFQAQAHIHARRQQAAEEKQAIEEALERWLPQFKRDYWEGHQYGRQGLESSWRWQALLKERTSQLLSELPFQPRFWTQEALRTAIAHRTTTAMAEDDHWIFYSPQMERSEYVRYCALILEEYGWTVVSPPPNCFHALDLAGEFEGQAVLFRFDLASARLSERLLKQIAQDARLQELPHVVWVLDGALHHEVRAAAELWGINLAHHDDLTTLGGRIRGLRTVS